MEHICLKCNKNILNNNNSAKNHRKKCNKKIK